ncbi:MAG: hypothetical protein R3C12_14280 [Planctomycetaceae bacterium]|nr:hypothetical protein [Planctomycetaceae bacterium]
MNSPKEPLSQAELDLLVQAHRLLEQGDLLQARTLFLSVMQQAPSAPEEFVQVRIAALAGLVEWAALQKLQESVEESIESIRQELESHPGTSQLPDLQDQLATRLNSLSERLGALRFWTAVKQLSRLVLRYVVADTSLTQSHRIRALNNLGSALLAEKRIDDAIHVWQTTIKDYTAKAAQSCPSPLATLHNNLAELRRLQCQIPLACYHHRQALALRLSCPERDPLLVRQSRVNLTQVLIESRDFEEARIQIEACLTENGFASKSQHPDFLRASLLKTRILLETGQLRTAETMINQLTRSPGNDSGKSGRIETETHLLRFEHAILLNKHNIIRSELERLPKLISQHQLEESILEARFLLLMGKLTPEETSGQMDHRETHTQRALQILRKRLPRNHPTTALAVFQLADIYAHTMRGQRAVQTANSAMAMFEQTFGDQSLPMIHAFTELGRIVLQRDQFKTVRQLMKLGLQIQRQHSPAPAITRFHQYDLLSQAYEGLQRPRLAAYFARAAWNLVHQSLEYPAASEIPLAERALTLSQQAGHDEAGIPVAAALVELLGSEFHSEHPRVYLALETLGRLYARVGQAESAAGYLSQILSVRCGELGENSPEAIALMELTADMHRQAGQEEKAEMIEEQLQLLSQKASHVLSDLL